MEEIGFAVLKLVALPGLDALISPRGRKTAYRKFPIFPSNHTFLMNLKTALEYHLAGRLSEAEELYQEILGTEPNNPDALYFLGVLARQQGKQDLAADFILRAISVSPSNPMYPTVLGNIFKDSGRFDEAAGYYRQGLAINPGYMEALFNLGNVLQQQYRLAEAIDCYSRVLKINPRYAEAHNDLGVALMAQFRWDEAVASFNQALQYKPGYAEAFNNLGVAFKNTGRMEESEACYRQALALKPDYAQALLNLGTIYFIKKDFSRAMTWYQASLAVDPNQVEAHQNIALILFDTGRLDEAQRHRDLAYRRQSIFINAAPNPVRTVLVLWAAGRGNVPVDHLLPAKTNTRITWMMEYATDEQIKTLPPYDLVFNAIGDQDAAGPTLEPVARFLHTCRKPVLNRPEAVANTTRDLIPCLLASIPNVLVPHTVRIDTRYFRNQLLATPGVRLPVLARPSGSHGGAFMVKVESEEELRNLALLDSEIYYATNYHNYCSADGYYRKYRIIFVDRCPYPYHLAIGKHWMVHYETADMIDHIWKRDEEVMFLEDPRRAIGPAAMDAVEAIGRKLDLDYCGVDFSILPDGRVLVFEANATMLVHPEDEAGILAFKNSFVRRIFDAFDALMTNLHKKAISLS